MSTTQYRWRVSHLIFLMAGLLGALSLLTMPLRAAQPKVMVLQVDGIISPATSDFIIRGLKRAVETQAGMLVIELDTPGGLDTSMRSIIRAILGSPIPIVTFVSPSGARAASAGTFILYASHVAAMTPASNVGAASPVSIGPSGPGRRPTAPQPGAPQQGDAAPDAPDTMTSKVTNDAAAYIRSLAQLRGRNGEFAENSVLKAASMSATEALEAGVIDLIANDVNELLAQLNGRSIKLDPSKTVTLNTADAAIERVTPDWNNRVLALLANPQIALILMMVGIFGLFLELTNPGVVLPGVAGLICLLLGLYAFQMLPVNWAGVGLLAAGTSMMIAEIFLPSFGVLGVGGIVAFVLGGIFLTDTGVPGFDLSIPFLVGMAVSSAAILMGIGAMALRAHKHRVVSGREQMVGSTGRVQSILGDTIYAEVHGERWRVRCPDPLSIGDEVRVLSMHELTLTVERIDSKKPSSRSAHHVL